METEQLADTMADAVNSGIDSAELEIALQAEHPYLQRELVNEVLIPALEAIANTPHVDMRNEEAVDCCEKLLSGIAAETEA
jgi:hypothetical protein